MENRLSSSFRARIGSLAWLKPNDLPAWIKLEFHFDPAAYLGFMQSSAARTFHFQLQRTMTSSNSNRRTFVGKSVALAAALGGLSHSSGQAATSAVPPVSADQFRFCLNTSTINNREVPIREQIKIAADAGYDSIEFWVRDG